MDATGMMKNDGESGSAKPECSELATDPLIGEKGKIHMIPNISENDPEMKERIEILHILQMDYFYQEIQYFEESHCLNLKFAKLCEPIFKKRKDIINGNFELNNKESSKYNKMGSKHLEEIEASNGRVQKSETEEFIKMEDSNNGIPDFWLRVLLNSGISKLIGHEDKLILKHLKDIKLVYDQENSRNFTLEFHFSQNDYFNNSLLTKEYEVKCILNEEDPFFFEGPEYVNYKGCVIDWREGKNIILNDLNNSKDDEAAPSFFNFFNNISAYEYCDYEDVREMMMFDFEIGRYIKERIIPRAILYYTGEMESECTDVETIPPFLESNDN